jgi:hypothetical protein
MHSKSRRLYAYRHPPTYVHTGLTRTPPPPSEAPSLFGSRPVSQEHSRAASPQPSGPPLRPDGDDSAARSGEQPRIACEARPEGNQAPVDKKLLLINEDQASSFEDVPMGPVEHAAADGNAARAPLDSKGVHAATKALRGI